MIEKNEEKVVVQSVPVWTWMILIAICLILVFLGGIKSCNEKKVEKKTEESTKTEPQTQTRAPITTTLRQTVEELEPKSECDTPCKDIYIGWDYKVRTDEGPIQVKNKNYTWDIRGKGGIISNPPKEFQPGEAEIVSIGIDPKVHVWIYKKRKIPAS